MCPGPSRGPPPPHREERHIQPVRQLPHAVEELGVAGEVHAPVGLEDEAERGRLGGERVAPAVVDGGHGVDADVPERDLLPGGQLVHVAAQGSDGARRSGASGHDDRRAASSARRLGTSRWSWCRCEMSTASRRPATAGASA
jgi:hypothetical protein